MSLMLTLIFSISDEFFYIQQPDCWYIDLEVTSYFYLYNSTGTC